MYIRTTATDDKSIVTKSLNSHRDYKFSLLGEGQRCQNNEPCGDNGCCVRIPGFGFCTNGKEGQLCGGDVPCGCFEGKCLNFRCVVKRNKTLSVVGGDF